MDDQKILVKETELANELRKLCTPYGDEPMSQLDQTSEVLLKMGKLYLQKAIAGSEMEQKLDYIKCSALLHGAIVRFDTFLNDKKKKAEVDVILNQMESNLLRSCKAKNKFISMLKTSERIKRQLTEMRGISNRMIYKVEKIEDEFSEEVSQQMEADNIKFVEYVMKINTVLYKYLMEEIATTCGSILGQAPCSFVLVGLGSLAREEISLCSDFEHVIVLEEGIQHSEDYHEIQEYFRWYTVLFQVIIIGLGETFIRSVGIRSINDLNSDDKKLNWYFDVITPCGVSFDGRVPHSCNNPLGRQEPTKNRKNVVELIQPASVMASYLTKDEHIKNGYYLKDILIRTCLVYGDTGVYEDFKNKSQQIMDTENTEDTILEQLKNIQKNVNDSIRGEVLKSTRQVYKDAKSFLYRPLTALLAYFARICKIQNCSSFAIIAALKKIGILNPQQAKEFQNALAIACELRLKIYAKGGHQRQRILENSIVDIIGKKRLLSCLDTILLLSGIIQNIANNYSDRDNFRKKIKNKEYEESLPKLVKAGQLIYLGLIDDAQNLLENLQANIQEKSYGERGVLNAYNYLALCYFLQGQNNEEKKIELFSKAEKLFRHTLESQAANYVDKVNACELLCKIYSEQQRNLEGLKIFEIWDEIINKPEFNLKSENSMQMRRLQVEMMLRFYNPKDIIQKLEILLSKPTDASTKLAYMRGIAEARILIENMDSAAKCFKDVIIFAEQNASLCDKNQLMSFLDGVLDTQLKHEWKEDASYTLRLRKILQESELKPVYDDKRAYENKLLKYHTKLATLKQSEENTKQKHITAALEICEDPKNSKNCYDEHAFTLALMLRNAVENIDTIMEAYRKAPYGVKTHPKLHRGLLHSLYQILNHYGHEIRNGHLFPIWKTLTEIFDVFHEHFKHPRFITILHVINYVISSRKEISDVLPKENLRDIFVMTNILPGNDECIQCHNYAMGCFANWEVKKCAQLLWKSISMNHSNPYVQKGSIALMNKLVLANPHMIAMKRIEKLLRNFILNHVTTVKDKTSLKYNLAVESYAMFETAMSAKALWEIITTKNSSTFIKRKSTVMLMFVVLTSMEKCHYGLEVNGKFMTLVKPGVTIKGKLHFQL
ncbi:uncharacterized protein LOC144425048 [Styela clava]